MSARGASAGNVVFRVSVAKDPELMRVFTDVRREIKTTQAEFQNFGRSIQSVGFEKFLQQSRQVSAELRKLNQDLRATSTTGRSTFQPMSAGMVKAAADSTKLRTSVTGLTGGLRQFVSSGTGFTGALGNMNNQLRVVTTSTNTAHQGIRRLQPLFSSTTSSVNQFTGAMRGAGTGMNSLNAPAGTAATLLRGLATSTGQATSGVERLRQATTAYGMSLGTVTSQMGTATSNITRMSSIFNSSGQTIFRATEGVEKFRTSLTGMVTSSTTATGANLKLSQAINQVGASAGRSGAGLGGYSTMLNSQGQSANRAAASNSSLAASNRAAGQSSDEATRGMSGYVNTLTGGVRHATGFGLSLLMLKTAQDEAVGMSEMHAESVTRLNEAQAAYDELAALGLEKTAAGEAASRELAGAKRYEAMAHRNAALSMSDTYFFYGMIASSAVSTVIPAVRSIADANKRAHDAGKTLAAQIGGGMVAAGNKLGGVFQKLAGTMGLIPKTSLTLTAGLGGINTAANAASSSIGTLTLNQTKAAKATQALTTPLNQVKQGLNVSNTAHLLAAESALVNAGAQARAGAAAKAGGASAITGAAGYRGLSLSHVISTGTANAALPAQARLGATTAGSGVAATGAAAGFRAFAASVGVASRAVIMFMATNPIGWILLIGTALVAVATNAFGFRDALNGIGIAIGNALPFMRPLLDILGGIGELMGSVFGTGSAARGIELITAGIGTMTQAFQGFLNIVQGGLNVLGVAFQSTWDAISSGFSTVLQQAPGFIDQYIVQPILSVPDLVKGAAEQYVQDQITAYTRIAEAVNTHIVQPLLDVPGHLGNLGKMIVDTIVGGWTTFTGLIDQHIVKPFLGIVGEVGKIGGQIYDMFISVWTGFTGWVQSNIVQPFMGIVSALGPIGQQIYNAITGVFGPLAGWINSNIVQPFIKGATDAASQAGAALGNLWNMAKGAVAGAATWANQNIIAPVVGAANTAVDQAAKFLSDIGNRLGAAGKAVGDWAKLNITDPIVAAAQHAATLVGGIAAQIAKTFADMTNNKAAGKGGEPQPGELGYGGWTPPGDTLTAAERARGDTMVESGAAPGIANLPEPAPAKFSPSASRTGPTAPNQLGTTIPRGATPTGSDLWAQYGGGHKTPPITPEQALEKKMTGGGKLAGEDLAAFGKLDPEKQLAMLQATNNEFLNQQKALEEAGLAARFYAEYAGIEIPKNLQKSNAASSAYVSNLMEEISAKEQSTGASRRQGESLDAYADRLGINRAELIEHAKETEAAATIQSNLNDQLKAARDANSQYSTALADSATRQKMINAGYEEQIKAGHELTAAVFQNEGALRAYGQQLEDNNYKGALFATGVQEQKRAFLDQQAAVYQSYGSLVAFKAGMNESANVQARFNQGSIDMARELLEARANLDTAEGSLKTYSAGIQSGYVQTTAFRQGTLDAAKEILTMEENAANAAGQTAVWGMAVESASQQLTFFNEGFQQSNLEFEKSRAAMIQADGAMMALVSRFASGKEQIHQFHLGQRLVRQGLLDSAVEVENMNGQIAELNARTADGTATNIAYGHAWTEVKLGIAGMAQEASTAKGTADALSASLMDVSDNQARMTLGFEEGRLAIKEMFAESIKARGEFLGMHKAMKETAVGAELMSEGFYLSAESLTEFLGLVDKAPDALMRAAQSVNAMGKEFLSGFVDSFREGKSEFNDAIKEWEDEFGLNLQKGMKQAIKRGVATEALAGEISAGMQALAGAFRGGADAADIDGFIDRIKEKITGRMDEIPEAARPAANKILTLLDELTQYDPGDPAWFGKFQEINMLLPELGTNMGEMIPHLDSMAAGMARGQGSLEGFSTAVQGIGNVVQNEFIGSMQRSTEAFQSFIDGGKDVVVTLDQLGTVTIAETGQKFTMLGNSVIEVGKSVDTAGSSFSAIKTHLEALNSPIQSVADAARAATTELEKMASVRFGGLMQAGQTMKAIEPGAGASEEEQAEYRRQLPGTKELARQQQQGSFLASQQPTTPTGGGETAGMEGILSIAKQIPPVLNAASTAIMTFRNNVIASFASLAPVMVNAAGGFIIFAQTVAAQINAMSTSILTFRNNVMASFSTLAEPMMSAAAGFTLFSQVVSTQIQAMGTAILTFRNNVMAAFQTLAEPMMAAAAGFTLFSQIVSAQINLISVSVLTFRNNVLASFQTLAEPLMGAATAFVMFGQMVTTQFNAISISVLTLRNNVIAAFTSMVDPMTQMATGIVAFGQGATTQFNAISISILTLRNNMTVAFQGMQQATTTFQTAFRASMVSVTTYTQTFYQGAKSSFDSVGKALADLQSKTTSAQTAFRGAMTSMTTYTKSFFTGAKSSFDGVAKSAQEMQSKVTQVQGQFRSSMISIATYARSAESGVSSAMSGIVNALDKAASKASSFASSFSSSMGKVGSAASDAANKVSDLRSEIDSLKDKTITVKVKWDVPPKPAGVKKGGGMFVSPFGDLSDNKVFAQHGASGVITRPTTLTIGEGFRPELVTVTPLANSDTGAGSSDIISALEKRGGFYMNAQHGLPPATRESGKTAEVSHIDTGGDTWFMTAMINGQKMMIKVTEAEEKNTQAVIEYAGKTWKITSEKGADSIAQELEDLHKEMKRGEPIINEISHLLREIHEAIDKMPKPKPTPPPTTPPTTPPPTTPPGGTNPPGQMPCNPFAYRSPADIRRIGHNAEFSTWEREIRGFPTTVREIEGTLSDMPRSGLTTPITAGLPGFGGTSFGGREDISGGVPVGTIIDPTTGRITYPDDVRIVGMQRGGQAVVNKPTQIEVGEGFRPELLQVIPLTNPNTGARKLHAQHGGIYYPNNYMEQIPTVFPTPTTPPPPDITNPPGGGGTTPPGGGGGTTPPGGGGPGGGGPGGGGPGGGNQRWREIIEKLLENARRRFERQVGRFRDKFGANDRRTKHMEAVFGRQVERYEQLLEMFSQSGGTDRTRELERSINRTIDFSNSSSGGSNQSTQANVIASAVADAIIEAMGNLKIELDGQTVSKLLARHTYRPMTGITR